MRKKNHSVPSLSRQTLRLCLLPMVLSTVVAGCFAETPFEDEQQLEDESVAVEESELSEKTVSRKARSCEYDNDCRSPVCQCSNDQCVPGPGGPPPPAWFCALPPVRECSQPSDCRGGCSCSSAGYCEVTLISPAPPNPRCHLPPQDAYEYDDTWANWSAYVGAPQVHNFHTANDRDWVAVYFAQGGNVRFRTHGLSGNADTKLKVFKFDNLVKGALVGVHDDIGGWFFDPDSKSSRVDITVPANSTYLVKLVNKSPAYIWTSSHQFPSFTFEISALN